MINQVNDALIDLRNAVNKKEVPENENANEAIDTVEKSLTLTNNNKVKGSKYQHPNKCFEACKQHLHK